MHSHRSFIYISAGIRTFKLGAIRNSKGQEKLKLVPVLIPMLIYNFRNIFWFDIMISVPLLHVFHIHALFSDPICEVILQISCRYLSTPLIILEGTDNL